MIKRVRASFLALLVLGILPGCSNTLEIAGAYFPAWLVSILVGILLTGTTRLLLFRAGIDNWIRPRAIAYPCLTLFFILLTYYLFFSS